MDIIKEQVIDILDQQGPALSSTSDLPVIETKPDSIAAPDVVEDEEVPETEGKTEDESAESPESPSETTEPKKARGVQKRLDELVKQREEAKSQYEAEKAEKLRLLALLETRGEQPQADRRSETVETDPVPVKPSKNDYPDPDAYDLAMETYVEEKATWTAKREIVRAQAEMQAKAQQDAIEAGERAAREAYTGRKSKVMEKYPDFAEVAETPDVQVSIPMAHAIINAPDGPDIQYYLGKNPNEAARIMQLSPPLQLMELGLISAKLREPAQPKPPISAAPKPIRPVTSGSESVSKSPDEMSMDEYAQYRREREKRANARH